MKKSIKKITATATLFFYLVSGQGVSAFAGTPSAPVGMSMSPAGVPFMGTSARQIARAPLSLPANLGLIEEFLPSASGSKLPAILHLQTAHGDYAAQMALVRLLNFLKKKEGFDLLLLEGADETLDPELDQFFKNDLWNQQVAKERVKTGRMSGAAYFLMRQPKGTVKAVGVESAEAYRNNRKDFLELIQKREALETYLKGAESDLDRLFARNAAKPLLDLRRQEQAFNQGRLDWASWIGELKKTALADLNLDLAHVSSQKEWPALLRFLWLREMDPVTEKGEASLADSDLSDSVKRILKNAYGGGDFRYGEVRLILEEWLGQKKEKKIMQPSADLKATLKRMALQNEIRPQELWNETETLTQKLMDDYAKTPTEKELLKLDSDIKLLRGLLLTEISFQEYKRVLERRNELQPSQINQSLQRLSQETAQPSVLAHENSARENKGDVRLNDAFQTALHFYDGAKSREKPMSENALKLASQSHAHYVVLVSGGFHAAGLRDELVRRGVTYLRVTPKTGINKDGFSAIVSQDPRAVYRQAFLDHSAGVESRAHIEDAAVLPISRTALDRLGVDARGFVANRTLALEAWSSMEGRLNGDEAARQFNASLFARQYGVQWVGKGRGAKFKTNRSEVRAAIDSGDLHKRIHKELHKIDEVLNGLPRGAISEFSKIQVLLAALYGGRVQLFAEQPKVASKSKHTRPHWEKRTYEFQWGLYAWANKSNWGQLSSDQRGKVKAYIEQAVGQLELLGIRVKERIPSGVTKGQISIGDVLTHAPAFQNPFLQTFLGDSKRIKSASNAQSRLERAVELLSSYSAVKGRKLTPAEAAYLRSFDNIFIPHFTMDKAEPFIIRVQHNSARGPYKGGIRLVDAFTLVNDKHFKHLFDDLKTRLNLQELRYFLRKYILEETLPLSFGMTSKAAVANLPYGGGKGTMLAADVVEDSIGVKAIADLHGGQDVTAYLFQLARGTARVFAEASFVRSDRDIPAADLNSGRYMDAMADEQIETVFDSLRPTLEGILARRRNNLPSEDVAFIEQLKAVPQYTSESLEKPLYLQLLTDYGAQLRASGRKIPSWAKPFFEAAATYTSKSEKLMGSVFRTDSTGYGGIHVLRDVVVREKLSRSSEKPLLGMSAKLMGLGAVGAPAAEKMIDEGMLIKLISLGPLGALYKADGGFTREEILLIRKMLAEKKNLGLLGKEGAEASGVEYIIPEQVDSRLLELDADVFVLAAVENAIHKDNVARANGKIFLELANGAITNDAYDRLVQDHDTMVIPDTMANAGGVTVSYYEWRQNLKNERWTRADVIERLEKQLSGGVERVAQVRQQYKTDWRTAADVLMILEVLEARRAEKSKSVRSKNKRSEVRVDTDVSTLANNFGTRRSEVRSAEDQIGGFSYVDLVKNGKVGVFPAAELVQQVTDYLQANAEAQGIFAAAVLAKGQDRENPDLMIWQSLVNEEGVVDPERVAAFVRQKVQLLALRKVESFEVHQFLYTLRDDEVEMIKRVGGKKTGLILAVFPEKTGGSPEAPGGRGQRPWDKPSSYGPRGGLALEVSSEEFEAPSLFKERETAGDKEPVTVKKEQRRSEVRAGVPLARVSELAAQYGLLKFSDYSYSMVQGDLAYWSEQNITEAELTQGEFIPRQKIRQLAEAAKYKVGMPSGALTPGDLSFWSEQFRYQLKTEVEIRDEFLRLAPLQPGVIALIKALRKRPGAITSQPTVRNLAQTKSLFVSNDFAWTFKDYDVVWWADWGFLTAELNEQYAARQTIRRIAQETAYKVEGPVGHISSAALSFWAEKIVSGSLTEDQIRQIFLGEISMPAIPEANVSAAIQRLTQIARGQPPADDNEAHRLIAQIVFAYSEARSEVRAAPSKLSPEEITAARTEEFFAIRDELLAIFSRYKKAKGSGKEAEQTRLLAQARRFSNVLPSFIGEIRSADIAEQRILDSYALMNGKTRQSEAVKLGQDIRNLTPRFVAQWQIYNRKGVLGADKKAANTVLNQLNAEVVQFAKRRLKLQLLQFKNALEADPLHQGTVFALLMSITDLYQRIRYEYQWRTFRSEGSIRTARLPMIGALGLVRDNLPYQSEPLLRVASEEQGGVTISQIVWKYKPVEGSEPALIPELTSMRFADFPTALRGKEHALESQEQDYAALTDHDFILRGVKDTLDWYVKSREAIPEETRDQLIATMMSVQAGPNGRFGLARRRARHYTPGARKVQANVLEKPGPKISLAIANVETGTVEKLKEASGAIEAAQLWTRARREYIERITAPATHRKRDYAYALMRDALIRDALNAIKTDVSAAAVSGAEPLLEKARTAEQNLRGLEQTYFHSIAQGRETEPEILLYKNLQREIRGIISTLAGLVSDISRPTLPKSAQPTAQALERKINGVLTMLASAAERRERSLSRSEVRADADASALQAAVKLDVSRQLAGTDVSGRSEVRVAPKAKFSDEQLRMIEVSAKAHGLKSEFKDYLAEMLWQAWHPDADKKTIKIKIGTNPGNFRLTAQMTTEELQNVFGAYNYALAIANHPEYAAAAKTAAVQVYSLDGGLGENLARSEFLEWLIKEGLLKETDVDRNPDGTIKIGAKGTDLGYILKIQGKKRYVRIAEAKLMQLVFMKKAGKFAELGITPLVNLQSAESYHKLLKNPYLGDILEKKTKIRTYGEALKDMGIQVVYDKGDQFYIAQNIPAIEMKDGQPVGPAQKAGIGVDIHGGHGMIPFDLFHSPEKWKADADQKPVVVWFSNGDGLNSSSVDEFVVGKMILDNLPVVNVLTAATLIDVKGGKNGVKLMTVRVARDVTIEIEVPQMIELSDAKAEGQAKEHQAAGLPEGAQYFGAGSIGKQLFNTNIFVIRMDLVMPILAEIKAALGAEEYFKIIAATRIKKPTKLGKDNKAYMPVDGTIGTSIHNLNEFIMTTRNAKVLSILKRYGFAEQTQKKGDSKKRLWGRPFLHFIDSPRTLFFTPTKFPFDMWLQAFSDYYTFDTEKFVFVDAHPDLQPPSVELGGAENKWWGELGNYVKIFGRNGKIQDLISLEIYGKVILSRNGKAVRLAKNVRIVNTTGKTVDFHAAKYRPVFQKFISEQGTLNLDGVTVMITPYGVMTSELSELYNVPGLSENSEIQLLLDTVKQHLFEGDYARTLAAAQQLAVALHDSRQTLAPEFLQAFSRELEKARVILSHSWAVQRMDKIIAEAKELKKEFGDGLIHKDSLTEGRQAWLEGQEDLALAYLEGALPVLNDGTKPALDAHFHAYITHIKDTIRYFRRVAISRAMDQVTLALAPLQLPVGSLLEQVQGSVAVSHYKEALRVLHRLRDEVVVSRAAGSISQKDRKKIEAAVDHLSRLIMARHLDYSHTAAEARSEVREQPETQPTRVTKELAEEFADRVYYAAIAGRPGAGKGTVTGRFIQEINALLPFEKRFEVLVTGDWFRGVMRLLQGKAKDGDDDHYGAVIDELPSDVGEIMASGAMVSDEVTAKFFNTVLRLPVFQGRRILFDGFPRTTGQLGFVKKGELFPRMDLFVLIDTAEETAVNRILGGNRGRADDKEASIRKRMAQFAEHTAPMMDDLRGRPETIALSGEAKPDVVYIDFLEKLNKRFPTARSEVRVKKAVVSGDIDAPSVEVLFDTTVSTRVRIRTAELFGGLFLTDDLNEWQRNGNTPAGAARYLEVPRVRSDLDSVLAQAVELFSTSKPATGEWLERFPGETLREQEKNTYIIGPELVRRYGPVLIALEQSAPEAVRLIVLAKNDTEARELESLVRPINSRLPKNRRLMIKTPQQSRVLLKADTLRGLGLGEVDAALLRQIIPDFLPLNVFELDAWVSQVSGLTALVQKFRALSALASAA